MGCKRGFHIESVSEMKILDPPGLLFSDNKGVFVQELLSLHLLLKKDLPLGGVLTRACISAEEVLITHSLSIAEERERKDSMTTLQS